MDYIQFHNAQTIEHAQVLMLQDLERLFLKSQLSLSKFGFPHTKKSTNRSRRGDFEMV
jgi:hypothetical protein